jgi:hypothetical protein
MSGYVIKRGQAMRMVCTVEVTLAWWRARVSGGGGGGSGRGAASPLGDGVLCLGHDAEQLAQGVQQHRLVGQHRQPRLAHSRHRCIPLPPARGPVVEPQINCSSTWMTSVWQHIFPAGQQTTEHARCATREIGAGNVCTCHHCRTWNLRERARPEARDHCTSGRLHAPAQAPTFSFHWRHNAVPKVQ